MTLSLADVRPLLGPMCDEGLVLIGGQALHLWAEALGVESDRPLVSKDLDMAGTPAQARRAAQAVGGEFFEPTKTNDLDGTNAGRIRATIGGHDHYVDVLNDTFGLDVNEVRERSLVVTVDQEEVRVLHPLSVMKSRLANVDSQGLRRDTPHAIYQAQLSIHCVAAFIERVAEQDVRAALSVSKSVFRYARGQRARRVFAEHQLDAFAAVQPLHALGAAFADECYPRWRTQVESRRPLPAEP